MKKEKILAVIGAIIVLSSFVVMGKDKSSYEKKEKFECVDQIIEKIDNNILETRSNKNPFKSLTETEDFKECLSERYRVAGADLYYAKIDIGDKLEMTDKEKGAIIEGYQRKSKEYKTDKKITLYDVVKYDAKCYYQDDQLDEHVNKIYMIIVDEGEGLVVDYFSTDTNYLTDSYNVDEDIDTTDSNTGE